MRTEQLDAIAQRLTQAGNVELVKRAKRWVNHLEEIKTIAAKAGITFLASETDEQLVRQVLETLVHTNFIRIVELQKYCTISRKRHWRRAREELLWEITERTKSVDTASHDLIHKSRRVEGEASYHEARRVEGHAEAKALVDRAYEKLIVPNWDFAKLSMGVGFVAGVVLCLIAAGMERIHGASLNGNKVFMFGLLLCWGGFLLAPVPGVLVAWVLNTGVILVANYRAKVAIADADKLHKMHFDNEVADLIRLREDSASELFRRKEALASANLALADIERRMSEIGMLLQHPQGTTKNKP